MSNGLKVQGTTGHVLENWSQTLSCRPELYFEPETTDEIREVIVDAKRRGKKVSVLGAGHSFVDNHFTNEYLICLKNYNRVLYVNKDKSQVTVQTGMVLSQLYNEVLPKHCLSTKAVPAIDLITVGGMICTGSHGTGGKSQITSADVVAMELMTASGEILRISETENKHLLPAARVSLGTLGVILNATLQCEPEYNLHERQYGMELEEVFEKYDEHWDNVDHFCYFWYPYTNKGMVQYWERTDKPRGVIKTTGFFTVLISSIVGRLHYFLYFLCLYFPRITPWVSWLNYHACANHYIERVDRANVIFDSSLLPLVDSMEYCVPRKNAMKAFQDYITWVKQSIPNVDAGHHSLLLRFIKADDMWLSPNYKTDGVYFNILLSMAGGKSPERKTCFEAHHKIMTKHGGRPHWGKVNYFTPSDFAKKYPEWNKFHDVRKKLDPTGLFMTEGMTNMFGK